MKNLIEAWKRISESTETVKPKRSFYESRIIYTEHLKEIFSNFAMTEAESALLVDPLEAIENGEWEKDPQEFYNSINKSSRKEMLTDYGPQDFAKMELFKVPGIDAGFALKPMENPNHKDIVAVHNNSDVKGLGTPLMKAAIKNGGTHLDHFDGFLSKFYQSLGFEEYGRDPYNPDYDEGGKLRSIYGEVPVIYRKLKNVR